ncbi:hypothetical protein B0J15DRAFT_543519 [Fusarium solani]|uniref:Uncharacterized protein n=1 Tax=Fusarium solani TaxID=169388 RepID=A0A9P9RCE8_FUSSL|nr:uncharacterized protein B0J15DRAFT_543519 [Fusarium solani]KAH7272935.1 hypothetical protein B0J15DRAFT_543519 [Fusarium solani]
MFSRQKNGLQVVGDIDAAGSLSKDKKKKGNGTQMVTYGANGEAIATVTIDIAFTNLAMRNFSVGDWDQLREIIRHVPLYHPFWRPMRHLDKRYGKAKFDVGILPVQQWMGGDVREQFGRPECTMLFLNASQLFQHLQDCHNLLHCRHPAEEAHTDQDAIDQICWDSRRPNGEKLNST